MRTITVYAAQVETSALWAMEQHQASNQLPSVPWTLSVLLGTTHRSEFDVQWYDHSLVDEQLANGRRFENRMHDVKINMSSSSDHVSKK